ncbi:MAG: hypothetical protein MK033_12655 [Candidatus Caenarcaniphilales bacterium]|nr:hypothetical protein [Candidatus Caenarcaniphilales bacterium]
METALDSIVSNRAITVSASKVDDRVAETLKARSSKNESSAISTPSLTAVPNLAEQQVLKQKAQQLVDFFSELKDSGIDLNQSTLPQDQDLGLLFLGQKPAYLIHSEALSFSDKSKKNEIFNSLEMAGFTVINTNKSEYQIS